MPAVRAAGGRPLASRRPICAAVARAR